MAKFGLNGYLCEMKEDAEDAERYVLTVVHSVHDHISARETVAASDLNHDYPVNSREQHEALFAPIIAKLEDEVHEAESKRRHEAVDKELDQEAATRKAQAQYQADLEPTTAEDGTTSDYSGDPEGDSTQADKAAINTQAGADADNVDTVPTAGDDGTDTETEPDDTTATDEDPGNQTNTDPTAPAPGDTTVDTSAEAEDKDPEENLPTAEN